MLGNVSGHAMPTRLDVMGNRMHWRVPAPAGNVYTVLGQTSSRLLFGALDADMRNRHVRAFRFPQIILALER